MTARKKTGLGFFISGAMFILGGIVCWYIPATPVWIPTLFGIVGLVGSSLGLKIVFPDVPA